MGRPQKLPRGIDRFQGNYRVRMSYLGHQYYIGSFPTLTDAKTALRVAWGQKASQTFVPPAERRRLAKEAATKAEVMALTVNQWSEVWLSNLESLGRSAGTLSTYRSALNVHVLDKLGNTYLVNVSEDDVSDLIDKIRADSGPWENVARTMRAMFGAAVDVNAGGLTVSPVKVRIPKAKAAKTMTEEEGVASPEEIRQLAGLMPDHLALAVDLAAWCALRLGECLGLQRRDFQYLDNPETTTLRVARQWLTKANPPQYSEPKADSSRVVAVPASLVPAIVRHLDKFVGEGPLSPVFPSTIDKTRPVSQTTFDTQWRKARDKVRPGLRFHDLRHTGLTVYARQGATLQELMKRGGHSSIETALRYQHADQARDRALTNKLDGLIGGNE